MCRREGERAPSSLLLCMLTTPRPGNNYAISFRHCLNGGFERIRGLMKGNGCVGEVAVEARIDSMAVAESFGEKTPSLS